MDFDKDTVEFLGALDTSTKRLYSCGLTAFQEFYKQQGTIKDFLDRVEEDSVKQRREKTRVARNTVKEFMEWLQGKGYKPKTVRAYIAAIQSEARYFDLSISTRYVNVPTAKPFSQKYPGTIEDISKFVSMIDKSVYKTLTVSMFQSGLSISDILALTYGDIQHEFESGVTPLCLDLARIKTDVPFMTFIGEWGISLLKQHLAGNDLKPQDPIFKRSPRTVDEYFERLARKFVGKYEGNNPIRPHSLRAAFRTILSDHKVDPLFIEFWMGHRVAEQQRVYVSKSKDGWRKTYREQAEPHLSVKSE